MATPSDKFLKALIQPGDILLYDRKGWVNKLIKFKRGEKYSHAAIASYPGYMLEAVQGKMCDEYPLRLDGLAAIYRHREDEVDFELGYEWFQQEARGQKYDWLGLLSFSFAQFQGRENNKMFCSEFVARFFAKISAPLFSTVTDADAVSPGMIPYSPRVYSIWIRADKRKS